MTRPLHLIVGARPNFIKVAPLARELARRRIGFEIIHTGQHYDETLSGAFFRLLDIPAPAVNLEVGSGRQGAQTARILERYEQLIVTKAPAAAVVFGDVTSTLACALAAVKVGIPVVHVEAGLRSFDRAMPEEINRIVTDSISDLLLVSEPAGLVNLGREGARPEAVRLVGNIMIDSLRHVLPGAIERATPEKFGLTSKKYALLTLHRPSNVDDPVILRRLMALFDELAARLPILFPAHPRTHARLQELGVRPEHASFRVVPPVDYLEAIGLQHSSALVMTDSGGVQEETTVLGVPCLTLRNNTERPVTVEWGTSTLVGNDPSRIRAAFEATVGGGGKKGRPIPLWDGEAAGRIADVLESQLSLARAG